MLCRFRYLALLSAAVLFLTLPMLSAQDRGQDCSYLVAHHSYANTFGGFMNAPLYLGFDDNGQMGLLPNAGAGVVSFLPGGVATGRETIVVGLLGVMQDNYVKGTYELKWDSGKIPKVCTGWVKLLYLDSSAEADLDITVTTDDQRVGMIHTNKGLIVDMTALPAKTRGCRNTTIRGTYTYTTQGWALMPGVPPDQTLAGYISGAMSGAFQFSPNGVPSSAFPNAPEGSAMVNGWDSLSANGTVARRNMAGWYKVEPDWNNGCSRRRWLPRFPHPVLRGRERGSGARSKHEHIRIAGWAADTDVRDAHSYAAGQSPKRALTRSFPRAIGLRNLTDVAVSGQVLRGRSQTEEILVR